MTQTPTQSLLDAEGLKAAHRVMFERVAYGDEISPRDIEAAIRAYIASQGAAAPSEEPLRIGVMVGLSGETTGWEKALHIAKYRLGAVAGSMLMHEIAAHDVVFASPAPVAPVEVSVNGLEWRNGYCDENVNIVQASFGGLYQVRIRKDGIWLDWPDRRASVQFPNVEAAKAAAQSDFNARILSSIIPATKPAVGVEALQAFSEQLQDYHAALAEHDEHLKPGLSRAITLVAGAIMDRAALAAKDTALSEMRAELERVKQALEWIAREAPTPTGDDLLDAVTKFFDLQNFASARLAGVPFISHAAARAASQDEGEER